MGKIAVSFEINLHVLDRAKRMGVDRLIYVKNPLSLSLEGIELINGRDYDRPSYRVTYDLNNRRLTEWKKIAPDFFYHEGVDLLEAINKDLFWANRLEGMLRFAAENIATKGDEIIDMDRDGSTWKDTLKFMWMMKDRLTQYFYSLKSSFTPEIKLDNCKYAFFVLDQFEYSYCELIANELGRDKSVFIANHSQNISPLYSLINKNDLITKRMKKIRSDFSVATFISGVRAWGVEELFKLIRIREELVRVIELSKVYFQSPIQVYFTVAQESTGFGNVLAQLGKKYDKLIVNSHNGLKGPDPFNGDNHFGIWFVWDESMKKMLNEECGVPKEQLIVSGHLMRDLAVKHINNGTFDSFVNSRTEFKIISFFSISENERLKWEMIRMLLEKMEHEPHWLLAIRLHPSEIASDWNLLKARFRNDRILFQIPRKDDGKESLYDLLQKTDVAVVFGSTVALECTWFNVPVVTLESRERSLLYMADGVNVIHKKTSQDAMRSLVELINRPRVLNKNEKRIEKSAASIIKNKVQEKLDIYKRP